MRTRHFELKINIENVAFEGSQLEHELCRILDEIKGRLASGYEYGQGIRDINGNDVGWWSIDPEKEPHG